MLPFAAALGRSALRFARRHGLSIGTSDPATAAAALDLDLRASGDIELRYLWAARARALRVARGLPPAPPPKRPSGAERVLARLRLQQGEVVGPQLAAPLMTLLDGAYPRRLRRPCDPPQVREWSVTRTSAVWAELGKGGEARFGARAVARGAVTGVVTTAAQEDRPGPRKRRSGRSPWRE